LGEVVTLGLWLTSHIRRTSPGLLERKVFTMSAAVTPFTQVGVSKITSPKKRRNERQRDKRERRRDRRRNH
jgi:hypothetical protein